MPTMMHMCGGTPCIASTIASSMACTAPLHCPHRWAASADYLGPKTVFGIFGASVAARLALPWPSVR